MIARQERSVEKRLPRFPSRQESTGLWPSTELAQTWSTYAPLPLQPTTSSLATCQPPLRAAFSLTLPESAQSPLALGLGRLAVGVAGGRVRVTQDAGTSATLVRSIAASGLFLGGPRDSMVAGQNGIAYVGNRNAQLRALNLNTGAQVSLAPMLGNAVGAIALDSQGHIYVGTSLGFLYRY